MNGEPDPGEAPIPTPYLFIPYGPGDDGSRPIAGNRAFSSQAIHPRLLGGRLDRILRPQIELSCDVVNNGAAAATAALIEFYAGGDLYRLHPTAPADAEAGLTLIGRARFVAPPGRVTTVLCPKPWNPGLILLRLRAGVLVQVRDLFTDPLATPFDALGDRHVARLDDPFPGLGRVLN